MNSIWNRNSGNSNIKQISWLFFLATICMLLWFSEIIIRDWQGLKWMNYFHIAWLVIPTFLLVWIVAIEGGMSGRKHFFIYPIMIFIYFILMAAICTSIWEGVDTVNYRLRLNHYSELTIWSLYTIPAGLFGLITFIGNLIVARVERKALSAKNKLVLFSTPYLIPIICVVLTMMLFTQKYLFPKPQPSPMIEGLDILHWIKSGSFIFAYIMYEGFYYLWLKGKIK
jgi:hypothetical protein